MNRTLRLVLASCLAACGLTQSASAELIYGVAAQGNATALLSWDSASPNSLSSGVFLSGMAANETLVGIDFRPATQELYGVGSTNRLYRINTATGVATNVGSTFSTTLNGFNFGVDFNPVIDRIRVVSEVNQNLVLNPITGAVEVVGTNLFFGPADPNFGVDPNVVDAAYSNNLPGAATTQLYGLDTGLDILVTQANNAGTLGTVGPLGVNVAASGGFDISGSTATAYAALLPTGASQSSLYRINLLTGAATNLGVIDGGLVITAMAIQPVIPEPATMTIALSSVLAAAGLRRRS